MKNTKRALLAGAIGLAISVPAIAQQFSAFYVFGDSLSDTGFYKPVLPPGKGAAPAGCFQLRTGRERRA